MIVRIAAHPEPLESMIWLRKRLGWRRSLFARLIGASERSLADWENGREPVSKEATRSFRKAQRIYVQATKAMRRYYIGTWLQSPVPALGGMKPLELIERGDHDRVWGILYEVEYGGYV